MKIRNPKSEIRKNSEGRNPSSGFGSRSSFGFRPSVFGFLSLVVVVAVSKPAPLLACAACYGASDSSLAKGMNWGIFSLLAVVVMVLAGISSFFVFIAKKSNQESNRPTSSTPDTRHSIHE